MILTKKPAKDLRKLRRKLALKISLILITVAFIFTIGFGVGFGSASGINLYQIINKNYSGKTIDFAEFWQVWDAIHNNYLHKFDDKTLFYSSIKGLVSGLNDPYSSFMDPSETKLFTQDMQEQFGGVGIEITAKDNKIVVVSILSDSPAKSVDMKTGDQIVSVDDKATDGHALMEVLSWIRGTAGTKVKLEMNREGWSEPKEFEFTRYNITVQSVNYKIDNNIAYIQITQFSDNTTSLVQKAALDIVAKNPKGIILDLRNNPGGLFDSAVDIASLFIEKGVVVYEQDKNGNNTPVDVKGDAKLKDFPLVILVNGSSASASEILSGALAYYDKGTLVGEKTFGKGVMQSWDSFSDGSSLILTVNYWLTPAKVGIDKQGITPDITIKSDKTDCGNDDVVCKKAKEIINQ